MFYSSEHDLKVRVSAKFWDRRQPNEKLDVCIAAAVHFNRMLPQGHTIVSPVCFVSCKTDEACEIRLTLPHATLCQFDEDFKKIVVLSTAAYDHKWSPDSPLFSPGEHPLVPLHGIDLKTEPQHVKFTTTLICPSLYAIAVKENFPCPLPLRCSLFVTYPVLNNESATVTAFDIMAYVGMALKSVTTVCTFTLSCLLYTMYMYISIPVPIISMYVTICCLCSLQLFLIACMDMPTGSNCNITG